MQIKMLIKLLQQLIMLLWVLNSYEEVDLAEELLNIHKWADQVKFARTGGEAFYCNQIARAAPKRKVLFCGYHVGTIVLSQI